MAYASVLASLAGGLLSSGGGIAGGIIGNDQGGATIMANSNPLANPLLALSSLYAGLPFGIVDQQLIAGISPLQRAINQFSASGQKKGVRNKAVRQVNQIFEMVQNGEDLNTAIAKVVNPHGVKQAEKKAAKHGGAVSEYLQPIIDKAMSKKDIQQFLGFSGYGSLQDLFNAETQFQATSGQYTQGLAPVAEQARAAQLSAIQQRANLVQNLPTATAQDIQNMTNLERQQMQAELDQLRHDALVQANIAGTNPGRQLSELDKYSANNLELQSLNRAIALLSGQQSLAGTQLGILDSAIGGPTVTAANLAQLGQGGSLQAFNTQGANSALLGQSIQNASNNLANTVASIPALYQSGATAPAAGPTVSDLSSLFYQGYAPNAARST